MALPVSVTCGSLDPPKTLSGTLSTGYTWFPADTVGYDVQLESIEIYVKVDCSVDLILCQTSESGGFYCSTIATVPAVAGLNTFSSDSRSLPIGVTIPARAMLGFYTATAGAFPYESDTSRFGRSVNVGYAQSSTATKLAGNTSALTYAFVDELQFRWQGSPSLKVATAVLDESFAGNNLPAFATHKGTAWTYANGFATPAATGLANRLVFFNESCVNSQTVKASFRFRDGSTVVAVGKERVVGGPSVDKGSLVSISIAANTITFYEPYNTPGTLPSVAATESITEMTLAVGRSYTLQLTKTADTLAARITDESSGETQEFSWAEVSPFNYAQGAVMLAVLAGSANFSHVMFTAGEDVKTVVYGDSIVTGSTLTTPSNSFGGQLYAANPRVIFSGDGGVKAISAVRMLQHDARNMGMDYAVFYGGANNTVSDEETTLFLTDFVTFWKRCRQYGITPVIMLPTPNGVAEKQTRLDTMRTAILAGASSETYEIIRSDIALGGVNGDTHDGNFMTDSIHPNQAGHDALFAKCNSDLPAVFN